MSSDLFAKLTETEREQLPPKQQPKWIDPMLATLTDDYFDDPDWIYERKLDGERCLVYRKSGRVRLGSRNRKDISSKYPELVEALEGMDTPDYIADGEIVAFEGDVTSFSKLQPRMQRDDPDDDLLRSVPVYLYLFDLVFLDGNDLSKLALRARKSLLRDLLSYDDPIRFTAHRNEKGKAYREAACRKGWEGVIAKDGESNYVHARSRKWLKFKCVARQELVIGGYTDPQGERIGFGAILVGYYQDDDLQYAGKVGTGFDDEQLKDLHKKFQKLERKTPPFAGEVKEKNAHWITPRLVAEIGFTEWTEDNKLRHPRFLGLREDKAAEDVVKEKPTKT